MFHEIFWFIKIISFKKSTQLEYANFRSLTSLLPSPGIPEAGGKGGTLLPDFGKSVNPISTIGRQIMLLAPPDFQIFRHPCSHVDVEVCCSQNRIFYSQQISLSGPLSYYILEALSGAKLLTNTIHRLEKDQQCLLCSDCNFQTAPGLHRQGSLYKQNLFLTCARVKVWRQNWCFGQFCC